MRAMLEKQFGSDAAFGLYFELDSGGTLTAAEFDAQYSNCSAEDMPGAQSFLADGGSGTCCTDYAAFIYKALPGRVQIFGFANEDNPDCQIVKDELHPGGHDFAVVDGRYLVDPWVLLVVGRSWPVVYDLQDPLEASTALHRYGAQSNWEHMHEAELYADKQQLALRAAA